MRQLLLPIIILSFSLKITAQNTQTSPLGINLSGIASWSQEYVFVDIMKCSRTWISQCNGCSWGNGSALPTDNLGWVTSLPVDHWAETVMLDENKAKPTGIYNLYYEGEGTFDFNSADIVDTFHVAVGHIQIEVKDGTDGIWLRIMETDPNGTGDYLRNIRLIMPGFENVYQTEPFHPTLIETWKDFSLLRFMDWGKTNGSPVATWNDRTRTNSQTQAMESGVAPEYMIALANQMQKDVWICVPHQADDNYVTELATMFRDNLNSNLKIYIEYSNEVWNGQFAQASYASAQGLALGLSTNSYEAQAYFHARRSVEIFNIFETVFGDLSRLERVVAWQNFNTTWSEQILDYNNTYQSTDALSIAPYFGSFLGDAATADSIAAMSVDSIIYWCEDAMAYTMQGVEQQAEIATARGLSLIAYEGGQHLVGHGGAENNTALEAKLIAANRDARMGKIYAEYFERWKLAGGELFAAFSSIGTPSKWGSWGLLEHYNQDYWTAPKYAAATQFNNANSPSWWLSPNIVAADEGDLLIDFDGDDLPALTISQNRNFTVNTNDIIIPFSTNIGDNLFITGDNQSEFYGGIKLDWLEQSVSSYIYNLGTYGTGDLSMTDMSGGANDAVKMDLIYLWKKDQFLNGYNASANVSIGKFKVNIINHKNSTRQSDFRFVILQNGNYYISDFMTYANGSYELDLFNNSEMPEKRWYNFNPTANNFAVPEPLHSPFAMNFDNVEAVGFVVSNYRTGYGATFSFDEFQVYTKANSEFTVRVNQATTQADPTDIGTIKYEAIFSEATTDFTANDVTIYGSATDNNTIAIVTEITPFDGTTYEIEVSDLAQNGFVVVKIDSLQATNATGFTNFHSTSTDNIVAFNGANNPTVTINQAATQNDATINSPILFTAVFSEAIINFEADDITLSGSANPTTAVITEIAPFDNTTFEIAVSGMSADGLVVAEIPKDKAETPIYAQGNEASSSDDNQVEFVFNTPTSGTLINFQGSDIPSTFSNNRTLQLAANNLSEYIPFSIADGGNLFTAESYSQMEIYGGTSYSFTNIGTGINHQMRNNDTGFEPNRFWSQIAAGNGVTSNIDMLWLWRKDQFLNNMNLFQVGFDNSVNSSLSLNVVLKRENLEIRFVIKQNGIYYMSEFFANALGEIQLTDFNNSSVVGKRWGIITPTATDFSIPTTLPTFQAIDFTDIEAVGFICNSTRSSYANHFSFDGFTANGITITNPLPVELLSFTGKMENENVILNWQTTTEINNAHFDVEFSTNGVDFEKIGQVEGAGTTLENQDYKFIHDLNLTGFENLSGLYYRLKQVDFDGKYDYSSIVNIEYRARSIEYRIYPNPVSDILTIEITEPTFLQITNTNGQVLKEQRINVTSTISVEDLPNGIYFLRTGQVVEKITVQH